MRAKLCQDNELGQQQEKDRSFTLIHAHAYAMNTKRNRESDKGCEQGELL
jgi:hypothetical protein